MNVIQNLLTKEAVLRVSQNIPGTPTEDRILLAVPKDDARTASGLIIPGKPEDYPRKGVIVKMGLMEQDRKINKHLEIGQIVTYGNYAGKDISFDNGYSLESVKFVVLSIEEVIYIEQNNH